MMRAYVIVDTPIQRTQRGHVVWCRVAVPAPIAHRLLAARLLSLDAMPGTLPTLAAVADDWNGEWWAVRDLIQIPGAFIERG